VHTCYSADSGNPLEGIISRAAEIGLNCLNVCDHNTVEGALKLQAMAPFKIIVSEEVETTEGEVMGLFLSETIPPGLSPEESIQRIRDQNGLVAVPHPFEIVRSSAMKAASLERIAHLVDIIEVRNAKTWPVQDVNRPLRFARERKLPVMAGSDAHTLREIGNYYMQMPDFEGREDFLAALAEGEIHGSGTSFATHCYSMACRTLKKLGIGKKGGAG
jgi:predicted metal-dependent phosphoesterase TrpH